MKLFVYAKHDCLGDFTEPPIFDKNKPDDYAEILARGLLRIEDNKLLRVLYDQEMLFLGTYDDKKVQFELNDRPIIVLKFSDYLKGANYVSQESLK